MNDRKEDIAKILAAMRAMIDQIPGAAMRVTYHAPALEYVPTARSIMYEPIDGLTDTLDGVAVQCEYAEAEAVMLGRDYCKWPKV